MSSLSLAVRLTLLLFGISATAASAAPAAAAPATAAALAAYPLKTCVVSDAKLGSMGKPVAHVYQQAGQPDRAVLFCCKACIRKFEKEPARYLAKLGAAEATAASAK
jgi:hypothetical protein